MYRPVDCQLLTNCYDMPLVLIALGCTIPCALVEIPAVPVPYRQHRHGREVKKAVRIVEDEIIGISSTQADLRLRKPVARHALITHIEYVIADEVVLMLTGQCGCRMPVVQDGQP